MARNSVEPTMAFYAVGSYDPWTGKVINQWSFSHAKGQAFKRKLSLLQEDDILVGTLFDLPVGSGPLRPPAGGVQLALGILPSGDYALLVPSFSIDALQKDVSTLRPHFANEFVALSPMLFLSKDKLLATLKRSKERKAAHLGNGSSTVLTLAGFEHARVLYQYYFSRLNPADLGIPISPSPEGLQIIVLQFNFWELRVEAAARDDVLLDASWGRIDFESKTIDDITYVEVNPNLKNPGRAKRELKQGTPITVAEPKVENTAALFRAFISSLNPFADLIILTHDASILSRAIYHLGLDDIFPQAHHTMKALTKPVPAATGVFGGWEGVGALVGYPRGYGGIQPRVQDKTPTPMRSPTPGARNTSYSRETTCSRETTYSRETTWRSASRSTSRSGSKTVIQTPSPTSQYTYARSPTHESFMVGTSYGASIEAEESPERHWWMAPNSPSQSSSITVNNRRSASVHTEASGLPRRLASAAEPDDNHVSTSCYRRGRGHGKDQRPLPFDSGSPARSRYYSPVNSAASSVYDQRPAYGWENANDQSHRHVSHRSPSGIFPLPGEFEDGEVDYAPANRPSSTPLFRPPSRTPDRRSSSPTPVTLERYPSTPFGSSTKESLDLKVELKRDEKRLLNLDVDEEEKSTIRKIDYQADDKPKQNVYAVFTQNLHQAIHRMWASKPPLHRVVSDLGLIEEDYGWCAGNELHHIWQAMGKMLSGPTVLEAQDVLLRCIQRQKQEDAMFNFGRPEEQLAQEQSHHGMLGVPTLPPEAIQVHAAQAHKKEAPAPDFYDKAMEEDEDDW